VLSLDDEDVAVEIGTKRLAETPTFAYAQSSHWFVLSLADNVFSSKPT